MWHNKNIIDVFSSLTSSLQGLTSDEAKRPFAEIGPNEIRQDKKVSPWTIFFNQFKSVLVVMLLVAVILSVAIGIINLEPGAGLPKEMTDAIIILAIVLWNFYLIRF